MGSRAEVKGTCRLILEIEVTTERGVVRTGYQLTYLHPYAEADPAWRLTKLKADGTPSDTFYDVNWSKDGLVCTCEDYNWCRQNTDKKCKHCCATSAVGLLRKES